MYTKSVIKPEKLPSIGLPMAPKWYTKNDFLDRLKPYLLGKIPYVLCLGKKEVFKNDIITIFEGSINAGVKIKESDHTGVKSNVSDQINYDANKRNGEHKSEKLPSIVSRKPPTPGGIKTSDPVPREDKNIEFDRNEYDWINISHTRQIKPKEKTIYSLDNALHIMTDSSIKTKQKRSNSFEKPQNTYEFVTRKPSDPPNDHIDPYKSYYSYPKTVNPYDLSQNGKGWRTVLKNNSFWEESFMVKKYHRSKKQQQKEKLVNEYYKSFDRVKCKPLIEIHHDYKIHSRVSETRERLVVEKKRERRVKKDEDEFDLLIQVAEVRGQGDKDMELMVKSLEEIDKNKSRSSMLENSNRERMFREHQSDIIVSLLNKDL
jgi:hypothetical protein